MRPIANFTFHAALAAVLAALAAASAAAHGPGGDADSTGFFQMRLGTGAADNRGQTLEVQSYHWGPRQTTSADGARGRSGNQVILDDTPGASAGKEPRAGTKEVVAEREKEEAAFGKLDAGMKELEAKDRMGDARSGHSMLGASDRVTVGGTQTETAVVHDPPPPRDGGLGSESERRQHSPVTFATPRDRGSLTIQASLPGCEVGKRYAGAQFAAGAIRYELTDVIISNCAGNSVGLNYGKVKVRAWEPEKKE